MMIHEYEGKIIESFYIKDEKVLIVLIGGESIEIESSEYISVNSAEYRKKLREIQEKNERDEYERIEAETAERRKIYPDLV